MNGNIFHDTPVPDQCQNCRFFVAGTDPNGTCKRFPHNEDKVKTETCGEFRPNYTGQPM
jgi:hypothetical protein